MLEQSLNRILERLGRRRRGAGHRRLGPPADPCRLGHGPQALRDPGLLRLRRAPARALQRDTWIQRDICDREPYPFDDDELDFVICSHTLEDVRDPIWVCSEMARIAKAGYIEVPSRLEEQSYGFQGPGRAGATTGG